MEALEGKKMGEKEAGQVNSDLVVTGDEFLSVEDLIPVKREAAERSLRRALRETAELMHEKKWEEMLEIFYPVDDKLPELNEYNLDAELRAKTAFALGQVKRFDEALKELDICVRQDPESFHHHSSLAYTAYNSLYAAKNREILLSGTSRSDRLELAHTHFRRAQELRPDGVTNFYREGMLYRQIENKEEKALPLFQRAVSNWEKLGPEEKEVRHQERKNYIKALYQLSSCLLASGRSEKALEYIKRCLSEDEKTNYFSLIYKYFALGKVYFHLNAFPEAKDALRFALQCRSHHPVDFVYELLGRTYLAMGKPSMAIEIVRKVPENKRRPYVRWTEADILCAMKDYEGARDTLSRCQERDRRSRHKALIRLAKLEYLLGNYHASLENASGAVKFFNEKWGGFFYEGIFWQALSLYRLGETERSGKLAERLKTEKPNYPGLNRLIERLSRVNCRED